MNYELIIKCLLTAWMITEFSPLQNILTNLSSKAPVWLSWIFVLLGCFKCTSFWTTYAITQNIWYAIGASIIAATYDRLINALPIRLS